MKKINWQASLPIPVLIVVAGMILWKSQFFLESDKKIKTGPGAVAEFSGEDCDPHSGLWQSLQKNGQWEQINQLTEYCLSRQMLKTMPAKTKKMPENLPTESTPTPIEAPPKTLPRRPGSMVPTTRRQAAHSKQVDFIAEDCLAGSKLSRALQQESRWQELQDLAGFCLTRKSVGE